MTDVELRALMPEDGSAAQALVGARLGGTAYEARAQEQLDAALAFDDPEYMALLASRAYSRDPTGMALLGTVSGAGGVVKLHALLGDPPSCDALLASVLALAADTGERLVIAELPDDAPFHAAIDALGERGFVEEGRVADFVADGIALRLFVWRPTAVPGGL